MPLDDSNGPEEGEGEPDPRKDGAFDQDQEDDLVPRRSVIDRLKHIFQLGGSLRDDEDDDG
jgi:hypothetical protein